jgi:hypothetical protein
MQSRKVALTSQDFVEQGNGLVQVSLGYTAAASDASSVLPLFRVDSQPPINPSIISLNELQSQKLYMTNFSSSQANGLLQITASYVGASLNALRKPLISDSTERQNIALRVAALRKIETAAELFDEYNIDLFLRNEEQQVAIVTNVDIDYAVPPVLDTNERAGLLTGATFTFRKLGGGGVADDSYVRLRGFAFRSMTALQIMQTLIGPRYDSGVPGAFAINVGKIEHVTPTVRLISKSYVLQFNGLSWTQKYGFTVR